MADTTALAESAQALFCALADYMKIKNKKLDSLFDPKTLQTYKSFNLSWTELFPDYTIKQVYEKHIETPQATFKDLEKFLTENQDWYTSSVLIAKKLVEDIDKVITNFKGIKKPKTTEIWFVRGDKPIMDNIQKLFDIANETQRKLNSVPGIKRGIVFGDINKWSPADIYFASDKARNKIEKTVKDNSGSDSKGFVFNQLNILISDLIQSGDLLPLSLKKQTRQVILQKVNFDRDEELKNIKEYEYIGTSDWKPYKVNAPTTRDMRIFFNPKSPKDYLKIKHDVSGGAFKVDVQYAGAEARGGSIGSINIFSDLVAVIDPSFAAKIKKTFDDGNKKYREDMKKWGKKPEKGSSSPAVREAYEKFRGESSALNVINAIMPPIKKWLDADKVRANKFIHIMYEYSTSRTQDSGKFVIAK